jgi:hypothetical protein
VTEAEKLAAKEKRQAVKDRNYRVAKAALVTMKKRDADVLAAATAAVAAKAAVPVTVTAAASLGQMNLDKLLERWMTASTDAVGTADYSGPEAAVYQKTMQMIGEDATLKVCTQF